MKPENSDSKKKLVIGIDASNLLQGGGVTHLIEILRSVEPEVHGIAKVIVWSSAKTLAAIDHRSWLVKQAPAALNEGLLKRVFWKRYCLSKSARDMDCDLLFVPGGAYAGDFQPVVTMSQNLLPFELHELKRYGFRLFTLRLLLLRFVQSRSFRKADGIIFLTPYAKARVLETASTLRGRSAVIPHGLNPRFRMVPKAQRPIVAYDEKHPYRLLYVSIIDQYKHQWHVVDAVDKLRRKTGWPLVLHLVGPAYAPALERLQRVMNHHDPEHAWIKYHGTIPYEELHQIYGEADVGIFASSCENMPNILIETMAAGLPVACSNRGPMPDVLGEAGVYFDPEQPKEIASTLEELIGAESLRAKKSQASYQATQTYTWEACASQTFSFLSEIARKC